MSESALDGAWRKRGLACPGIPISLNSWNSGQVFANAHKLSGVPFPGHRVSALRLIPSALQSDHGLVNNIRTKGAGEDRRHWHALEWLASYVIDVYAFLSRCHILAPLGGFEA